MFSDSLPPMPFKRLRTGGAGFTLAEAVITVMVSAISLASVMVLNAQQLRLVRSTKESNGASLALQNRVEQMRVASWNNLTNGSYLTGSLLSSLPAGASNLANYTETVTVGPWPDNSAVSKLVVKKIGTGQASIVQSSTGMASQRQARVDVVVGWSSIDGRKRERSYATIISNGGITRVGLLAIGGSTTSGVSTSPSGSDSTPPSGSETPPSGDSGSGGTTTTSPGNSGSNGNSDNGNNGNGRGNAGGKGGKG